MVHYNTPDLIGTKYSIVYYTQKLRPNKVMKINEDDLSDDNNDGNTIVEELNCLDLEDDFDDSNSCYFDEN